MQLFCPVTTLNFLFISRIMRVFLTKILRVTGKPDLNLMRITLSGTIKIKSENNIFRHRVLKPEKRIFVIMTIFIVRQADKHCLC